MMLKVLWERSLFPCAYAVGTIGLSPGIFTPGEHLENVAELSVGVSFWLSLDSFSAQEMFSP